MIDSIIEIFKLIEESKIDTNKAIDLIRKADPVIPPIIL
jgi:hypothetical protein